MADSSASLSFERVAECYDATRGGEERGGAFATGIRPWLPDDGPILEIGVGTGAVAVALRRAGLDVIGVDLSPGMLAKALDRIGPRVAVADAHRLPIVTGSMAAVYATWVLHVVADPSAVLAEVARVLRPGGTFVGSVPNAFRLKNRLLFLTGREFELDPTHLHHFSPWTLRALLGTRFEDIELRFAASRLLFAWPRMFGNCMVWRCRKRG